MDTNKANEASTTEDSAGSSQEEEFDLSTLDEQLAELGGDEIEVEPVDSVSGAALDQEELDIDLEFDPIVEATALDPESDPANSDGEPGEASSVDDGQRELRLEILRLRGQVKDMEVQQSEQDERLEVFQRELARAQNDLQSARNRAQRDREESKKFGAEPVLRDLFEVMDNLDRALETIPKEAESWAQGVVMTHTAFLSALVRHGVERVCPEQGDSFDPRFHEAMARLPGALEGQIAERLSVGYTLHERLVRPATVVVGADPPPASDPEDTETVDSNEASNEIDSPMEGTGVTEPEESADGVPEQESEET